MPDTPIVHLVHADLTTLRADAIVNAANAALAGGGGVDGALHRAGGPAIAAACRALPFVRPGVRCPTGEARVTTAGLLQAKVLIHAVGPIHDPADEAGSAALLRDAVQHALDAARAHRCRTVALPALSTGAYRYPVRPAARVILTALRDTLAAHPDAFDRITVALFSDRALTAFREAAAAVDLPVGPTG